MQVFATFQMRHVYSNYSPLSHHQDQLWSPLRSPTKTPAHSMVYSSPSCWWASPCQPIPCILCSFRTQQNAGVAKAAHGFCPDRSLDTGFSPVASSRELQRRHIPLMSWIWIHFQVKSTTMSLHKRFLALSKFKVFYTAHDLYRTLLGWFYLWCCHTSRPFLVARWESCN